jgi:hypothetical protein
MLCDHEQECKIFVIFAVETAYKPTTGWQIRGEGVIKVSIINQ